MMPMTLLVELRYKVLNIMRYRSLIIIGICLVLANSALSQTSSDIADWFRSLKTPNDVGNLPPGISCCDQSDCKQRQMRYRNDTLEAYIEEINDWRVVPDEARITDSEVLRNNPFFQAVVCFIPVRGVICYVPGNAGG
jgi:hypothetical protein